MEAGRHRVSGLLGSANHSNAAFENKKNIIAEWIARASPSSVLDLGANNGEFPRLVSSREIPTIAFDVDPAAVEQNQRKVKNGKQQDLLLLVFDLTDPSSSLGRHDRKRQSLLERGPAEMIFVLALIHHSVISNNVPSKRVAKFMAAATSKWSVVEFVSEPDSQVQKLLASRLDIFDRYIQDEYERAFETLFAIREKVPIRTTERILYLMQRNKANGPYFPNIHKEIQHNCRPSSGRQLLLKFCRYNYGIGRLKVRCRKIAI